MLEFALGAIFGFVAGCSLKALILSKLDDCKKNHENPLEIDNEDFKQNANTQLQSDCSNSFNLCSIQSMFDKYGVKLASINSFTILLNKIERVAYKATLAQFSSSIHTPEDLFALIEHGNTYNEIVKIQHSNNSILLSEKHINEMLEKNGISYSNMTPLNDKIQALVTFHISKGLSQFQKTMGPSLKQFISDYKENKDVSILFEGIMANINRALNVLA